MQQYEQRPLDGNSKLTWPTIRRLPIQWNVLA